MAFVVTVVVVTVSGLESKLYSEDLKSTSSSQTNSVAPQTSAPAAEKSTVKAPLTGAELYSINCNRCHAERYPTERTGAQWKTIMLHMQVRANIPVSQARLILKYLQDNSGR